MILPTVLALLAAFTFAANNATLRRGVVGGTLSQAMVVTLLLGTAMVWIAVAVGGTGHLQAFPLRSTLLFSAAGLLHFGFGRYCNYRATRAMGTVLVGPVQQTSVLITLVLAIVLLGERLTTLHIVGIALIIAAPMLAARAHAPASFRPFRRASEAESTQVEARSAAGFQPKLGEGYLFATFSALAYGSSPMLLAVAEREGVPGRHIAALRALSAEVDAVYGRHITINATGATAALLGEIAIPQKIMRGVAVISRSAGLVGHILEESREPSGAYIWETVDEAIPYSAS
ncbi:EamA family transporter [Pigmentiphaga daeguensis]|uniref:EamA domain-containing protein n=1 Tax=Pigmentiphaga daeguensis TaxID=414049 RepID=A0ABN1B5D4_9BURK